MRTVRVKQKNLNAVVIELQNQGFAANPCPAPNSERALNQVAFEDFEFQSEILAEDVQGFVGIETDASGNQVHKIISSLKKEGKIK